MLPGERAHLRTAIQELEATAAADRDVPHDTAWRSRQMVAGLKPSPSWSFFDFLVGWSAAYADRADETGDSGEAWLHWQEARRVYEDLTGKRHQPRRKGAA